jgi:hypothetical protein
MKEGVIERRLFRKGKKEKEERKRGIRKRVNYIEK